MAHAIYMIIFCLPMIYCLRLVHSEGGCYSLIQCDDTNLVAHLFPQDRQPGCKKRGCSAPVCQLRHSSQR